MIKIKTINFFLVAVTVWLYSSSCASTHLQTNNKFYFPPQWEPQESVWLGWSVNKSVQDLHIQMAQAIHPHVGLTILARSDSLLKAAFIQLQTAGLDTNRVKGYVHYIPNLFIRDAGPRFLKNQKGELAVADFEWNNYGYPKEFENDQFSIQRGILDNDLAKQMMLNVISSPAIAEGGGLDVSNHDIISFKETALQRNPGLSLTAIEKEYLRIYGKHKMVWLNKMPVMDKVVAGPKAGNYFGYGANGHIDEFARFVNDSTILISQIDIDEKDLDPVSKVDYEIMKENLEILKKEKDINGKPYNLVILPTPAYLYYAEKEILDDTMINTPNGKALFKNFKAGDEIFWLPAVSYSNFFITNNVVLLAKYWHEGLPESERLKDEKAKRILQDAFPGRKIIQLHTLALNRNGGGMNCATQQQPKL